jgi:hypothetical protein
MMKVKILHPQFGEILKDEYTDSVQYKIFLTMIHSCLELKQDLTTFNGRDFLMHIPYEILRQCIILGDTNVVTLGQYATMKSKMEG